MISHSKNVLLLTHFGVLDRCVHCSPHQNLHTSLRSTINKFSRRNPSLFYIISGKTNPVRYPLSPPKNTPPYPLLLIISRVIDSLLGCFNLIVSISVTGSVICQLPHQGYTECCRQLPHIEYTEQCHRGQGGDFRAPG